MKFEEKFEQYLDVILQVGCQLQPGQKLALEMDVRDHELAEEILRKAYHLGAYSVDVEWKDPILQRDFFLYAPRESLDQIPPWIQLKSDLLAEDNTIFLSIRRHDFESFCTIDPSLLQQRMKAMAPSLLLRREKLMKALRSWCLASLPTQQWAEQVFPGEKDALPKLWDEVFRIMRCDQPGAVQAWKKHADQLKRRRDHLNSLRLHSLHMKSSTMDLTIPLAPQHYWQGGEKVNQFGQPFIANLPTEEVHTMPLRTGAKGWVKNTRPLFHQGQIIDHFTLHFEEGKVVSAEVQIGEARLHSLLEVDEGARYLGEVALVGISSPISQSGLLFKDTLYDENASCHLALGASYPSSLIGGKEMNPEALEKAGANHSLIHVDFMVGSEDLNITGIHEDGTTTPLFIGGEWALPIK